MIRRLAVLAAPLALVAVMAASCPPQDPCASLAPPTAGELQAAASGADVDREVGDTECELAGDRWSQEAAE